MVRGARSQREDPYGTYMFRGGNSIHLEKIKNRFTAISATPEEALRWSGLPGIKTVRRLTRRVYKVDTTAAKRDAVMEAIRKGDFHTIVHHAYSPQNTTGTMYYLTDQMVVQFKTTEFSAIEELCRKHGLVVMKKYRQPALTYLLKVTAAAGMNPLKVANRLAKVTQHVSFAEPNLINRFRGSSTPQPALTPAEQHFPEQWHLHSKRELDVEASASIDALTAWQVLGSYGDPKIVVAVLDDGFDLVNTDFKPIEKIVHPRDFVDKDDDPLPSAIDHDFHGTPCAALAIAEANGEGVVGVAPGCSFMPVRIPFAASDNRLAAIFEEVGQHAHVISLSMGNPPARVEMSSLLDATLTKLAIEGGPQGKGCVICVSAGNWAAPIQSDNPKGFTWFDGENNEEKTTTGPIRNRFAAHPAVIAVGACTSLRKHAAYSNWGPELWVCAPSDNFQPLEPSERLPGRGIVTADNEMVGLEFALFSRVTFEFGGTSAAAPQVAGVAALILSANPNLTATEVRNIIRDTADEIVDEAADVLDKVKGRGIPVSYEGQKARSDWFGYGKVNAGQAVASVLGMRKSRA